MNKQENQFEYMLVQSNKVKTDGKVHYDEMNQLPYQEYYDYAHVTTITLHKDGTTTIKKTEEILKKNGVKYTDYVPMDNLFGTTAKKVTSYSPPTSSKQIK